MQDLSLHILDIAENALRASASIVNISLKVETENDVMELEISDNGSGLDESMVESVLSPFATTRTTRNVGLGLPMLAQSAEATGGKLDFDSVKGKGTTVKAKFILSHVDLIPVGNLKETLLTLIIGNAETDFEFDYELDSSSFHFDTRKFREKFHFKHFYSPEMMSALRMEIKEGLKSTTGENEQRKVINVQ